MLEGLFEDAAMVAETGDEEAAVDQVEFLGVGPFIFHILDLEVTVWRNAGLLATIQLLVEKNT